MPIMQERVRTQAQKLLAAIVNPVKLVMFTQEMECPTCREARQLAEEVASLSEKLALEIYNLMIDTEKAKEYGVDRVPTLCVVGAKDYGIRFNGIPAGYEFTSLMNAVKLVSDGDSGLKPETRKQLAGLAKPVDIQTFVTLTCPYCPVMAFQAQRMAVESDNVSASVVDSAEFPHLANLYQVMAVPKTVINKAHSFEGVVPEERLIEEIEKALSA
ncbi:MAG: thioredoxin family protein [candidate division WOR-3 bacterium]|nr:MAG: thioredoxin family protein [candidate division WOR-3 bacterium]